MKKDHIKTYIIVAIFISIIGISIAYAALQQQLQIKTNASVQSSQTSWNISYQEEGCFLDKGYVKLGTMTVNGTTITLSGFTVQAPGSSTRCYFNIINNGELNAKISSISGPNIVFTGSGDTKEADEKLVKDSFWLDMFARWNENPWPIVKEGDKVLSGRTRPVLLSIGILDSMPTLPTNPVTFSITYTINFEQA